VATVRSGSLILRLLDLPPVLEPTMRFKLRFTILLAAIVATNFQAASAQIPATINAVSSNLKDVSGFDRTAEYVVNGAGFSAGTHSINPEGTMWLNNGTFAEPNDLEPEITFDLGSVQAIGSMKVWNYNETLPGRPELLGRGVGSADILVAGDDLVFSTLIAAQAFDIAPGVEDVDFGQTIDLNTSARYVKLDILGNAGGDNNFVGLSEVQFNAVPEPASLLALLIGLGLLTVSKRRR
jgi:hypothetical protein